MTLKEKLCEPFGGLRNETVKDLEKIADEFAIGFSKWLITDETDDLMFNRMQDDLENTYENLLEIYKKGL